MKVKLYSAALALCMGSAVVGMAQAAGGPPLQKKITLTADINDTIFVSKPDGVSWYTTEALDSDYLQTHFNKTLKVLVYSTTEKFTVALAQPLVMNSSTSTYSMQNPVVKLSGIDFTNASATVTQKTTGPKAGTYRDQYDLSIDVDAPTVATGDSPNGSYSGDLIMVFETTT